MILTINANAGVQVIYPDGEGKGGVVRNTIDVRNLEIVEDRSQLAQEELKKQIELIESQKSDTEKSLRRLKYELARSEKEKAVAQQKVNELAEQKRAIELSKERRDAIERNQDYDLIVDHTQKVISHIGTPPDILPAVNSEGADVPLRHAFSSLVPLDWQLYLSKDISPETLTTWDANNKNWLEGLYDIGTDYGYQYNVNWIDRWVLVSRSNLRLGGKDIKDVKLRINGLQVAPGEVGTMYIDGKLLQVESIRTPE